MPSPIYTSNTCPTPAYQLDWSYSIFWRTPPPNLDWLAELTRRTEQDGIRILQHQFTPPSASQFLVSTQTHVAPLIVAQRVKGRLQHLLQPTTTHPFRRNYAIRSIGSTRREKLEQYLATQLEHHQLADERFSERFRPYQIHNATVDLSSPCETTHARYWYNLHIVIVNEARYFESCEKALASLCKMIRDASTAKRHRLSRAAVLPDHLHLTIGCRLEESPADVALSYMNNLAFASGMKSVFKYSYYVGTFSEYDLGVIPRP